MTTDQVRLDYFFDPFCGWWYASAKAVEAMAERFGPRLNMQPSELFTQPRPVSAIADHAFKNDTRIGQLTGQVFTDAYHQGVMRAPNGVFDSMPATRALVALGQINRKFEASFLHAVQLARYVDGRDTSKIEEVAGVAAAIAGDDVDAAAFAERLGNDDRLAADTNERIARTQAMMQALQTSGVPQLLVTVGNEHAIVQGHDLYSGGDHLLALLDEFLTSENA